ncbi:hypothetical protein ACFOQM_01880 [Paenibacillus sp. GCM10012307]|uniref:Uncharacterized protein n=1 Tax=Paenibacillus roseus TaxID=2798579 RepID=A0A934MNP8_9BACL|nr:hypothetical protein [Paenibacillus roseus]MBJ6360068.1 hypothetical protein [Paenibacillus roseus]
MKGLTGVWSRLRQRISSSTLTETIAEHPDMETQHEEEIVQGIDELELHEQLRIIGIAGRYLDEHYAQKPRGYAALDRGFALKSQMFVTSGEEPVYRVNLDVFYQDSAGQRKFEHIVSLIRFGQDEWHVFQVK